MQNRCSNDQSMVNADAKASVEPGNYMLRNDLTSQPHVATTGSSGIIMSFDNAGSRADIESSLQYCTASTRCGPSNRCQSLSDKKASISHLNPIDSDSTRSTNPTSNHNHVDRFIDMPIHPRYRFHVGLGENTRQSARDAFLFRQQRPIDQSGFIPDGGEAPFYKPCISHD